MHRRRIPIPLLLFTAPVAAPALAELPPVPVPPENPLTEEKRVLGKILFWDEQLSSDDTVACGSCHRPGAGGADPRAGLHPGREPGSVDDVAGSRIRARPVAALIWVYSHLPLAIAVTGSGVAIKKAVAFAPDAPAPDAYRWLVSSMLALALLSVAVIDSVTERRQAELSDRARVNARLDDFDRQGLSPFTVEEGSIGSRARAIGGACLPLLASFSRDRDVLFKEAP